MGVCFFFLLILYYNFLMFQPYIIPMCAKRNCFLTLSPRNLTFELLLFQGAGPAGRDPAGHPEGFNR